MLLSLVFHCTHLCCSLLTMILILDNTELCRRCRSCVVYEGSVVNKINNLGDVGVEGCVGSVAKLLGSVYK